jgi:hypothetical protein
VAALTVALSSIPYAVGYLSQSPERVFAGAVYDWEDYYSHLAKMQQGAQGRWLYRDLFTPEDHAGVYINTFYVALGHLAAVAGLSPVLVYQVARPLCAMALLLVAYWFAACFVSEQGVRRTAYVLLCFSSGLGWLVLLVTGSFTLLGVTPVDLWFIEMYTFFTVLTFPHTCLAMALHLLAFAWMVRLLWGEGGWRDWLAVGGVALILAVIHPYSVLPLDAALLLWWLYCLVRQRGAALRRLPRLIGFCALPLPLVVYGYRAIAANPVLSAWQAQSYTLSPSPLHYILGYGLVLALAVWGGVLMVRTALGSREGTHEKGDHVGAGLVPALGDHKEGDHVGAGLVPALGDHKEGDHVGAGLVPALGDHKEGDHVGAGLVPALGDREGRPYGVALVLWLLAVAPLLYAPVFFNLQRRMIEGVHAPLCVLAAVGLNDGLLPIVRRSRLAGWLARRGYPRSRFRRLVGSLVLAFTVPSTVYLLVSLSLGAAGGYGPLYYSRDEVEAVRWLSEHGGPDDTVLASYEVSGYIPAHIGQRVFWGHWAESIHLPQKRAEAEAFYSASALDRPEFLARYGIVYVFHGPRERAMGDFDPALAGYLEPVFRQGDVAIYRVEAGPWTVSCGSE